MKLIGFIKEYNNIRTTKTLETFLFAQKSCLEDTEEIVNYLNQGILVFGWMEYIIDIITKETIAPNAYYTDGLWVWPSYLPYYVNKYKNVDLDIEFIDYVKSKEFVFSVDNRINTLFFENALQDVFDGASPEKFTNITGIGNAGIDYV